MRKLDFEVVFELDHKYEKNTIIEANDMPFIPSRGDTIDFNNFDLDDIPQYEWHSIKDSEWEIIKVTWIKSVYNIYKIYALCKKIYP